MASIPASSANSPGTMTISDALQRIDNTLTRVPMKMQEEHEQLMEARQLLMNVIQAYEGVVKEKALALADMVKYSQGLEEILAKSDIKLELPPKPESLKVTSPQIEIKKT